MRKKKIKIVRSTPRSRNQFKAPVCNFWKEICLGFEHFTWKCAPFKIIQAKSCKNWVWKKPCFLPSVQHKSSHLGSWVFLPEQTKIKIKIKHSIYSCCEMAIFKISYFVCWCCKIYIYLHWHFVWHFFLSMQIKWDLQQLEAEMKKNSL